MAVRKQEFNDDEQQKQQKVKRSRITFDVSPEMRRRIKVAAAQNNLSIGEYLGRMLEDVLPEEKSTTQYQRRPLTHDIVKRVREVHEQIIQDTNGYIFEDSTETIRQMREERSRELDQL